MVAKLNFISLENIDSWMVVLHGHRLFDWKSFAVTDRSAKTTKPLHLEQSAMFGSYSNNSDISNVQFSNLNSCRFKTSAIYQILSNSAVDW